ncbi:eb1 protein homologue, putative [Theileria annulata]|uniref:Eb1 protein homologue, putative n=1 Tax=Theileria annulata TaxID=5874 RepID=Q4UB44_THEAN|nr:eb1 protein homologue, putative [Theileria annulata]CAI75957.1 eb1 protein homologue, putative [Theileria annulata]|eukprot:XP_955433.1 eb1 protein homologue, putative [Theileria annulata]
MDKGQFNGKTELLVWLNKILELKVEKIDQCSNGAIYLQLIDTVYQDKIPFVRIKWNSTLEYEHLYNYKLLQSVFKECNIDKHIPVEKLVRGKYQENLEFLQWMKEFVVSHLDKNFTYNPQYKRVYGILKLLIYNNRQANIANVKSLLPKWAWSDSITNDYISKVNITIQMESGSSNKNPAIPPQISTQSQSNETTEIYEPDKLQQLDSVTTLNESSTEFDPSFLNKEEKCFNYVNKLQTPNKTIQHLTQQLIQQKEEISILKKKLKETRMECQISNLSKDFYYNKLRQIEILCQKNQGKSVDPKLLFNIMYANN